MKHETVFDGTARTRCPISAKTRHSQIGVFRHRVDDPDNVIAAAPAQDAHLVIIQLKDQPAHDFWADDRHIPVPPTCAGTLGIIDMRCESKARFRDELESLHIHIPGTALDDLANDAAAAPVTHLAREGSWTPNDRTAQQLSAILVPIIDNTAPLSQAFIDHVVLAMASHVAATYGGMHPKLVRPGGLAPWQLRRAKELLSSGLADKVALHEVAEACGLSVSYFSRAFKVATGTTPHSWLLSCRVERARDLLADRSLALADIALRSGFADQSHFTRVFRLATGHTPGAWRRLSQRAL